MSEVSTTCSFIAVSAMKMCWKIMSESKHLPTIDYHQPAECKDQWFQSCLQVLEMPTSWKLPDQTWFTVKHHNSQQPYCVSNSQPNVEFVPNLDNFATHMNSPSRVWDEEATNDSTVPNLEGDFFTAMKEVKKRFPVLRTQIQRQLHSGVHQILLQDNRC